MPPWSYLNIFDSITTHVSRLSASHFSRRGDIFDLPSFDPGYHFFPFSISWFSRPPRGGLDELILTRYKDFPYSNLVGVLRGMIPSFFFEKLAGPEPGHKPNTPPLDHLLLTITNEVDGKAGRQIPFWPRHPWYTPIGSFHHEKNEKTDGGRRASCVRTVCMRPVHTIRTPLAVIYPALSIGAVLRQLLHNQPT